MSARKNAKKTRRRKTAKRRNPPAIAAVRHGSRAGHVLSRHVLSISYYHAESAGRRPYVHQFEREDIEMLGLPDGSLVIRHPHYRLWEDRVVPENA